MPKGGASEKVCSSDVEEEAEESRERPVGIPPIGERCAMENSPTIPLIQVTLNLTMKSAVNNSSYP